MTRVVGRRSAGRNGWAQPDHRPTGGPGGGSRGAAPGSGKGRGGESAAGTTRRHPTLRTYAAVLTAALLLGAATGLSTGTAAAADNGRWSVFPAPAKAAGKGPTAQQRPFFTLEGAPGTTLKDKVSVSNLSSTPMTFKLYGADAYNTPRDGGFAVRGIDDPEKDIGTWVTLARSTLTIPARTRADIPFTVTIPENATPGDHPGAIVALDTHTDPAKGSVAVGVRRAVGARVYLRVSGPTLSALSIENVHVSHGQPLVPGTGASTATIRYTLVNRGNVSVSPRIGLTAKGLFGRTLLDRSIKALPQELLPGQKAELTEKWADAPQFDRVTVRLTAADDTTRTTYTAIPWLPVGLALAALAGLVLWLVRRRRPRRPSGRPAPEPAKAGIAVAAGRPR
ncbi:WxL protein peptidoglycan domain-containing protein [Actinacidiphila oryziradicis]|uniref:DUF916 domain-containing protein n=1 Tax=Actinacidiphila oryziradicis TaxID=2571141 RepID=A0A4U0SK83_9ACTN|nr:DUF916 domain-containing protein [Actinacidiphila oryziradicis]TKA10062.1 DUF916 domain-containing protein [Actinacidiphila oryziradicis]